jgi:hypothetical protein
VSGLSVGQVQVTASVGDVVSEPVIVGVVADPDEVAIVRIQLTSFELVLDDSRQLTAQSTNSRGEVLDTDLVWSSSDETVAIVDNLGRVSAVGPGAATITAETAGIVSNRVRVTVPGAGRVGAFESASSRYRCEGSCSLQAADSGGLELVFGADFLVTSGPRLEVFLSTTNTVGPGSLQLIPVQSLSGAQSYGIDAGVEIDDFDWVVIHCVPFNVTFGYARLQ